MLGAAWLVIRLGFGRLPAGASWGMLTGLALLAGIGFTVSLFIAGLAFPGGGLAEPDAKVGILTGSAAAALLGAAVLLATSRRRPG